MPTTAKKKVGLPPGLHIVEPIKPIPKLVLDMWKLRTCGWCQGFFRTGETDHLNPNNPFCSMACQGLMIEARERESRAREEEDAYWNRPARPAETRGKLSGATCPQCSRKIYGIECWKCGWKG